jgi:hypothetical protein
MKPALFDSFPPSGTAMGDYCRDNLLKAKESDFGSSNVVTLSSCKESFARSRIADKNKEGTRMISGALYGR